MGVVLPHYMGGAEYRGAGDGDSYLYPDCCCFHLTILRFPFLFCLLNHLTLTYAAFSDTKEYLTQGMNQSCVCTQTNWQTTNN